jgi:hypothetical protein
MSTKTLTRPAQHEAVENDYNIRDYADEILERHLTSSWVKCDVIEVGKNGNLILPDDFPEELEEAWDGLNI